RADLARVPRAPRSRRRLSLRRVVRGRRDVRAGREPLPDLRRGVDTRRAAVRGRGLEMAGPVGNRRGGRGGALVARPRSLADMSTAPLELTLAELEAGLDHIRASPRDVGTVEMIVRRPRSGEREVLASARLDPDAGLVGDRWGAATPRRGD